MVHFSDFHHSFQIVFLLIMYNIKYALYPARQHFCFILITEIKPMAHARQQANC